MAKDPAILFYWNDWIGGTATLSRFQKGCYMDLLAAQFNSGHLSLENIKTVLGADFGATWPSLQKKFKQDLDGLFFNGRLEAEILKRRAYSKSRSDNRKKTHVATHDGTYQVTHVNDMENENRNENKNKDENKEEGMGGNPLSDFETWATNNFHHIEVISLKTGAAKEFAQERLHLFHLDLQEHGRYPIDKKAALAGFEKYLIHSINKIKRNGTTNSKGGHRANLTQSTAGKNYTDSVL